MSRFSVIVKSANAAIIANRQRAAKAERIRKRQAKRNQVTPQPQPSQTHNRKYVLSSLQAQEGPNPMTEGFIRAVHNIMKRYYPDAQLTRAQAMQRYFDKNLRKERRAYLRNRVLFTSRDYARAQYTLWLTETPVEKIVKIDEQLRKSSPVQEKPQMPSKRLPKSKSTPAKTTTSPQSTVYKKYPTSKKSLYPKKQMVMAGTGKMGNDFDFAVDAVMMTLGAVLKGQQVEKLKQMEGVDVVTGVRKDRNLYEWAKLTGDKLCGLAGTIAIGSTETISLALTPFFSSEYWVKRFPGFFTFEGGKSEPKTHKLADYFQITVLWCAITGTNIHAFHTSHQIIAPSEIHLSSRNKMLAGYELMEHKLMLLEWNGQPIPIKDQTNIGAIRGEIMKHIEFKQQNLLWAGRIPPADLTLPLIEYTATSKNIVRDVIADVYVRNFGLMGMRVAGPTKSIKTYKSKAYQVLERYVEPDRVVPWKGYQEDRLREENGLPMPTPINVVNLPFETYESGIIYSAPDGDCAIYSLLSICQKDSPKTKMDTIRDCLLQQSTFTRGKANRGMTMDKLTKICRASGITISRTCDFTGISSKKVIVAKQGTVGHIGWFEPDEADSRDYCEMLYKGLASLGYLKEVAIAQEKVMSTKQKVRQINQKLRKLPNVKGKKLSLAQKQARTQIYTEANLLYNEQDYKEEIKDQKTSGWQKIVLKELEREDDWNNFNEMAIYYALCDIGVEARKPNICGRATAYLCALKKKNLFPHMFANGKKVVKLNYQRLFKHDGSNLVRNLDAVMSGKGDKDSRSSTKNCTLRAQIPLINKATTLSAGIVAQIHTTQMNQAPIKETTSEKPMLTVNLSNRCVQTNYHGKPTAKAVQILNLMGLGVSAEKVNKASNAHGGHVNLRTFQNEMKASALSQMYGNFAVNKVNFVVDIGAKFRSEYRLLTDAVKITFDDVIPYDKGLAERYIWYTTVYSQARSMWNLMDQQQSGAKVTVDAMVEQIVRRLQLIDEAITIGGDGVMVAGKVINFKPQNEALQTRGLTTPRSMAKLICGEDTIYCLQESISAAVTVFNEYPKGLPSVGVIYRRIKQGEQLSLLFDKTTHPHNYQLQLNYADIDKLVYPRYGTSIARMRAGSYLLKNDKFLASLMKGERRFTVPILYIQTQANTRHTHIFCLIPMGIIPATQPTNVPSLIQIQIGGGDNPTRIDLECQDAASYKGIETLLVNMQRALPFTTTFTWNTNESYLHVLSKRLGNIYDVPVTVLKAPEAPLPVEGAMVVDNTVPLRAITQEGQQRQVRGDRPPEAPAYVQALPFAFTLYKHQPKGHQHYVPRSDDLYYEPSLVPSDRAATQYRRQLALVQRMVLAIDYCVRDLVMSAVDLPGRITENWLDYDWLEQDLTIERIKLLRPWLLKFCDQHYYPNMRTLVISIQKKWFEPKEWLASKSVPVQKMQNPTPISAQVQLLHSSGPLVERGQKVSALESWKQDSAQFALWNSTLLTPTQKMRLFAAHTLRSSSYYTIIGRLNQELIRFHAMESAITQVNVCTLDTIDSARAKQQVEKARKMLEEFKRAVEEVNRLRQLTGELTREQEERLIVGSDARPKPTAPQTDTTTQSGATNLNQQPPQAPSSSPAAASPTTVSPTTQSAVSGTPAITTVPQQPPSTKVEAPVKPLRPQQAAAKQFAELWPKAAQTYWNVYQLRDEIERLREATRDTIKCIQSPEKLDKTQGGAWRACGLEFLSLSKSCIQLAEGWLTQQQDYAMGQTDVPEFDLGAAQVIAHRQYVSLYSRFMHLYSMGVTKDVGMPVIPDCRTYKFEEELNKRYPLFVALRRESQPAVEMMKKLSEFFYFPSKQHVASDLPSSVAYDSQLPLPSQCWALGYLRASGTDGQQLSFYTRPILFFELVQQMPVTRFYSPFYGTFDGRGLTPYQFKCASHQKPLAFSTPGSQFPGIAPFTDQQVVAQANGYLKGSHAIVQPLVKQYLNLCMKERDLYTLSDYREEFLWHLRYTFSNCTVKLTPELRNDLFLRYGSKRNRRICSNGQAYRDGSTWGATKLYWEQFTYHRTMIHNDEVSNKALCPSGLNVYHYISNPNFRGWLGQMLDYAPCKFRLPKSMVGEFVGRRNSILFSAQAAAQLRRLDAMFLSVSQKINERSYRVQIHARLESLTVKFGRQLKQKHYAVPTDAKEYLRGATKEKVCENFPREVFAHGNQTYIQTFKLKPICQIQYPKTSKAVAEFREVQFPIPENVPVFTIPAHVEWTFDMNPTATALVITPKNIAPGNPQGATSSNQRQTIAIATPAAIGQMEKIIDAIWKATSFDKPTAGIVKRAAGDSNFAAALVAKVKDIIKDQSLQPPTQDVKILLDKILSTNTQAAVRQFQKIMGSFMLRVKGPSLQHLVMACCTFLVAPSRNFVQVMRQNIHDSKVVKPDQRVTRCLCVDYQKLYPHFFKGEIEEKEAPGCLTPQGMLYSKTLDRLDQKTNQLAQRLKADTATTQANTGHNPTAVTPNGLKVNVAVDTDPAQFKDSECYVYKVRRAIAMSNINRIFRATSPSYKVVLGDFKQNKIQSYQLPPIQFQPDGQFFGLGDIYPGGWEGYATRAVNRRRTAVYIPIRPCADVYDQTYWAQNYIPTLATQRRNIINMPTIHFHKGYYEEVQQWSVPIVQWRRALITQFIRHPGQWNGVQIYDTYSVSYFMNDSFYYIRKMIKAGNFDHFQGWVYLAGGDFHHMPGRYVLPFGQGTYTVYSKLPDGKTRPSPSVLPQLMVSMNTQGTAQTYTHPWRQVPRAAKKIHFGWYSVLAHAFPSQLFQQEVTFGKGLYTSIIHQSVQATWMMNVTQNTPKALLSIADMKFQWEKYALQDNYMARLIDQHMQHVYHRRWYDISKDHLAARKAVEEWVDWACTQRRTQVVLSFTYKWLIPVYQSTKETAFTMFTKKDFGRFSMFDGALFCRTRTVTAATQYLDRALYCGRNVRNGNKKVGGQNNCVDRVTTAQRSSFPVTQRCWLTMDRKQFEKFEYLYTPNPTVPKLSEIEVDKEKQTSSVLKQYFEIKKPDLTTFTFNPLLVPQGKFQSNVAQLNVAKQWLQDHPEPVIYDRVHGLKALQKNTRVTKTGFDFIFDTAWLGQQSPFQWSSKSPHNALCGLFDRHLAAKGSFDNQKLAKFSRMCDRFWKWFAKRWEEEHVIDHDFDPWKQIDNHAGWDTSKKIKYKACLDHQLTNPTAPMISTFRTMVKSGEVYMTDLLGQPGGYDQNGFFKQKDSRPRNICIPCKHACGMLTSIQKTWWKSLKKVLPWFIQGMDCHAMADRLRQYVQPNWKSVSIDGSAWDSTQFAALNDAGANKFLDAIKPSLLRQMQALVAKFPNLVGDTPQSLTQRIIAGLKKPDTIMFVKVGDIKNAQEWPAQVKQVWKRDHQQQTREDQPWKDYLYFYVNGTMFSGHPWTTGRNTISNGLYTYFYLEQLGIMNPWQEMDLNRTGQGFSRFYFMCAGDDNHSQGQQALMRGLARVIRLNTHTSKDSQGPIGLGQIVKSPPQGISVGQWYDFDFCSKILYTNTGTLQDFSIYRDYMKTLKTKQFYAKNNKLMLDNPALHAGAIYESVKAEEVSKVLQDIMFLRAEHYGYKHNLTKQTGGQFNEHMIYMQKSQHPYQHQNLINQYLGVGLHNVIDMCVDPTKVYAGGRVQEGSTAEGIGHLSTTHLLQSATFQWRSEKSGVLRKARSYLASHSAGSGSARNKLVPDLAQRGSECACSGRSHANAYDLVRTHSSRV